MRHWLNRKHWSVGMPKVVCLAIAALLPNFALAEWTQEERSGAADQLAAAIDLLDVEQLPDLESAQAEFLQAVESLDTFLTQTSSDANRDAWFAYLQPETVIDAIESGAAPADQGRMAQALQHRMSRNLDGLNLTALRRLRTAAEHIQAAVRFRRHDQTITQLSTQLDRLATRVREMEAVPSPDDAAALSVVMTMLELSDQEEALAAITKALPRRPNARVMVGENMINRVASRNIQRCQSVNDCILGTRIKGSASLNGSVQADLLPSQETIQLRLTLAANFSSQNVGYNGPVSVDTVGCGSVTASRLLLINESGIHLQPVTANANVHTDILRINHPLKLVRKIASKRAAEQKPQAERIAVQKLESQVASEFDRQTAEFGGRRMDQPLNDLQVILQRLDLPTPERQLYAGDDFVYLDLHQAAEGQVAALTLPPSYVANDYLSVQLHESVIDNVASRVLAGRTMTKKQLDDLLESLQPEDSSKRLPPFIDPPEDSEGDAADASEEKLVEPYEIDFARFRPVIFESRDNQLRFGIRGTRFSQSGRELARPIEITAVYEPVKFEDKVYLLRKGGVDVDFPGRGTLSVSQVAIKGNIQTAFAEAFPKAILNRPVEIPMQEVESLKIYPRDITSADGWLSVGMR